MDKLVEVFYDEPMVGSYSVAHGLGREHDKIRELIEKYRNEFENFSRLKRRKLRSTGGRAANEYMLDIDQFMFLGTLMRNSPKVVAFKLAIIKEFKRTRNRLEQLDSHKESPQHQIARDAGKIVRRQTTDTMQEFVEYAKLQGSQNADRYYVNITGMLNSLLFIIEGKYKIVRSMLSTPQLMTISSAEQIVDRALKDGMSRKRFYKDIYQDVKGKVALFAELHGKSEVIDTIPQLEVKP